MKLLPSLDAKDRRLLIGCMTAVIVLAFVTAFLSRNENDDNNTVPSSYLTGKHGARAAYELLKASGYNVRALGAAAERSSASAPTTQTVVIFAEPDQGDVAPEDLKAVRDIVTKGGRVAGHGLVRRHDCSRRQRSTSVTVSSGVRAHAAGVRSTSRLRRSVDGS